MLPPPPKRRAKEDQGVVTRGSSRPHGAETAGSSRPQGAETISRSHGVKLRGFSRPRRDRPDSEEPGTRVSPRESSFSNIDGTHRTPNKTGMSSSTGVVVLHKHRGVGKVEASTSSSRVSQAMVEGAMSSQKRCTTAKGSTSSSGQMSKKFPTEMKAGISFLQKNRRDEKTKALVITKPQALGEDKKADEAECVTQQVNELVLRGNKEADEAEQAIQQLNQLGLGEGISHDQYLIYLGRLPSQSLYVDTSTKLHGTQLVDLEIRLALHRLNYAKAKDDSKFKELCPPCLPEKNVDCSEEGDSKLLDFLLEQRFFKHFEKDGTLDWYFHPDSYNLAGLDDYQRIVPRNHGYVKWDEYRTYFHSYGIESEYVNYCEELSRELKWMEDYVCVNMSPFKRIFTRGAYQATKIATGFQKMTWSLASNGYHEFLDDMSFDICWYKELDGVYFEIWQLIAKQKKCFRDALDEVFKLNKFPRRQPRMKHALDTDCSKMEEEFCACTKGITGEVTDEKAQDLIAEAVKKLREKPKFYEHYIRKKMDIARDIRLIP